MTRWVAASTLDRAARVIAGRPGLTSVDLAAALGMSPASMFHVLEELRATGEVLPRDVIAARPTAPRQVVDETQQRILVRARRGIVVVRELPAELDEPPEEVRLALLRLRRRGAVYTPAGIWPAASHHNPRRRPRPLLESSDD